VSTSQQRPLELILARNLLSSLTTPGVLVNQPGDVVFYNDAAATLLGRHFEETGAIPASEWVDEFGPVDDHGERIPLDRQPLLVALRANRAGHVKHRIRLSTGVERNVEVSGVPIMGTDGFLGGMVFFWETAQDPDT